MTAARASSVHPRKLHHEIFEDGPFVKIGSLEKFRLYGIIVTDTFMHCTCLIKLCAGKGMDTVVSILEDMGRIPMYQHHPVHALPCLSRARISSAAWFSQAFFMSRNWVYTALICTQYLLACDITILHIHTYIQVHIILWYYMHNTENVDKLWWSTRVCM